MKSIYIFPTCLIVLNVAAGIVSFIQGDWKRGIYWFAAAVLNAAVAF